MSSEQASERGRRWHVRTERRRQHRSLPGVTSAVSARGCVDGPEVRGPDARALEDGADRLRSTTTADAPGPRRQRAPRRRRHVAEDPRAARVRGLRRLEHHEGRALAEPVAGESERRQLALHHRIDFVDAARQHGRCLARRHRRRRARDGELAGDRRCVECEPELARAHGDSGGGRHRVHHGIRKQQRRQPGRAALEEPVGEDMGRREVAELRAHDEPETAGGVDAGLPDGPPRGGNGQLADAR